MKNEIDQKKLSSVVNGEDIKGECIPKLVAYNGSLHIAHWMADTKTNEHKTLGDLYEAMIDLVDKFAEVYMGKYGVISYTSEAVIEDISKQPVTKGLAIVGDIEGNLDSNDDDLLNITADMKIALNKAKYLLKE